MLLKCVASSSLGNGYILESDNEILLLEAGCDLNSVQKMIDFNISKVVGMIISHEHGDHCKYIKQYMSRGIKCYSGDKQQENIKTIYGEQITAIPELSMTQIGGFKIIPFPVQHSVPNFGYIINHKEMGTLLFATDMEYISYDLKPFKLNHMMLESNYSLDLIRSDIANYKHKLEGHCSIQATLKTVRQNVSVDLKNVILCHLGSFSDPELFKRKLNEIPGCFQSNIASPGLIIELNKSVF